MVMKTGHYDSEPIKKVIREKALSSIQVKVDRSRRTGRYMINQEGKRTVNLFTLILCFGALFVAQTSIANNDTVFSAVYEGKYSGWNITMERSLLKTAENNYILVSQSDQFFASIKETSQFTLEKTTLFLKIIK